jgi:glycosyltransferase involved in cell wall biosynthesis
MSSRIKFTIGITTFNRADRLIPTLKKYETYDDVDEIIVVDDCSSDYEVLIKQNFNSKIKIYKNNFNLKPYKNKLKTLELSTNTWTVLMDSDNFCGQDYIDCLQNENINNKLNENIIYCPVEFLPTFKFPELNDLLIDKNIWNNIHKSYECFFNAGNMCISKKASNFLYTNLQNDSCEPIGIDCKYMNYILIKNGFILKALKNLKYRHALSEDSWFLQTQHESYCFLNTFNWLIT